MADIVDFNQTPPQYSRSVHTPDYLTKIPDNKKDMPKFAKPGILVNPDVSRVENIPTKYWKKGTGNKVIEMTTSEKQAIDNAEKQGRKDAIDNYEFNGGDLAQALVDAGLVTKKQITDFVKIREGVV